MYKLEFVYKLALELTYLLVSENIVNCKIREDGTGAFQWWHTWHGLRDGYAWEIGSTFYRVGGIEVIGGGIRRFFP